MASLIMSRLWPSIFVILIAFATESQEGLRLDIANDCELYFPRRSGFHAALSVLFLTSAFGDH